MSREFSSAIVFCAPGVVELGTFVPPDPGARDLAIDVEYSGVSQGTALWALAGERREVADDVVEAGEVFDSV